MEPNKLKTPIFNQREADNLFLASRNGLRTYADLRAFASFFLQFLFDFEHDIHKPVGFLARSSDEFIFAIGACWQAGIPFICFNPSATQQELDRQLKELQPGLIFTDDDHKAMITPDRQMDISQLNLERSLSVEITLSNPAKRYDPNLDGERIFGYFFTSGTTGRPKIVPLKRRQMLFAAESSAHNFRPRLNHFWLLCLPLNHIGGISIITRSILYGSGIYRLNRFDTNIVSTFIAENTLFQAASLVPTMLKRLLENPTFQTHKKFKAILLGGGPIDHDLLKEATERGIPVVSSYGMTETCAQVAANSLLKPSGIYTPLKSVGRVFSPNQLEIRDSNHQNVSYNNSGTIWLKGPQVFDGYLLKKHNLAIFDEDSWFNTGDYGHLNANGQLFIESRRTDLIVTGGENVSPHEVEQELEKIEPISEAAVFGMPDKEWGQKVVAVVVARTKSKIRAEEILSKLKERITSHKIPKQIIQTDILPRTETGKLCREELLKMFE